MNYSDAIVWLKEHNIKKEDGTFYEFGEVCIACCFQGSIALIKWVATLVNELVMQEEAAYCQINGNIRTSSLGLSEDSLSQ